MENPCMRCSTQFSFTCLGVWAIHTHNQSSKGDKFVSHVPMVEKVGEYKPWNWVCPLYPKA